jgi:hypothetical protein
MSVIQEEEEEEYSTRRIRRYKKRRIRRIRRDMNRRIRWSHKYILWPQIDQKRLGPLQGRT